MMTNLDLTATASGNLIRLANDNDLTLEGGLTALELTTQGVLLSSAIDPQLFPLDFPVKLVDSPVRCVPALKALRNDDAILANFSLSALLMA